MGPKHFGSDASHVDVTGGEIEKLPGFEPAFKAELTFGADWPTVDPDGQHARVDVRAIAKTEDAHLIDYRVEGIIKRTGPMVKVFTFQPDMATTPFGYATGNAILKASDPSLKALDSTKFVSNVRMVVTEKGEIQLENRSSAVVFTAMQ
ncbi:putative PKS/NRPS-like protein biosynthetic cluster [Pestalotiopsis sp. IQ-011]